MLSISVQNSEKLKYTHGFNSPPPGLIVPVYIEFSERECMKTTYIILVCSDNQWVILAIDEILIKARRTKSNTTASLAILGAIFVF